MDETDERASSFANKWKAKEEPCGAGRQMDFLKNLCYNIIKYRKDVS